MAANFPDLKDLKSRDYNEDTHDALTHQNIMGANAGLAAHLNSMTLGEDMAFLYGSADPEAGAKLLMSDFLSKKVSFTKGSSTCKITQEQMHSYIPGAARDTDGVFGVHAIRDVSNRPLEKVVAPVMGNYGSRGTNALLKDGLFLKANENYADEQIEASKAKLEAAENDKFAVNPSTGAYLYVEACQAHAETMEKIMGAKDKIDRGVKKALTEYAETRANKCDGITKGGFSEAATPDEVVEQATEYELRGQLLDTVGEDSKEIIEDWNAQELKADTTNPGNYPICMSIIKAFADAKISAGFKNHPKLQQVLSAALECADATYAAYRANLDNDHKTKVVELKRKRDAEANDDLDLADSESDEE